MPSWEDDSNNLDLQIKVLQEKLDQQIKFNNQENGTKTKHIAELEKNTSCN